MTEFAVVTPDNEKVHVAAHNLPRVGEDLALPDPDTGRSVYRVPTDKVYRVVSVSHPTKEASERASHLGIHVPLVRVQLVADKSEWPECTCTELYNSGGGSCDIHGKIS